MICFHCRKYISIKERINPYILIHNCRNGRIKSEICFHTNCFRELSGDIYVDSLLDIERSIDNLIPILERPLVPGEEF